MSLALDLALFTGQRQGDLLVLCWSSYDGERLTFRQGKRKRKIDMPVSKRLKTVLDTAFERKRALTFSKRRVASRGQRAISKITRDRRFSRPALMAPTFTPQ
jgi:integrase